MKTNESALHHLQESEISRIDRYRKSKKTAVLTILFTDIVGSTHAAEKLGESQYLDLKYLHDEVIRSIICRGGAGEVIKEIGDSFLAVFSEPSTAVVRAIEIQETIASLREKLSAGDYTLTVRTGLHLGQVSVEDRLALDIFGRHVNRAARIMALALPGQVLASQSIWDNASGWLREHDSRIKWMKVGKTRLKGIAEAVEIYEFFPVAVGSCGTPAPIKWERRRKGAFWLGLFLLVATGTLALFHYFQPEWAVQERLAERGTWYIEFDFSVLAEFAGAHPHQYLVGKQHDQILTIDTNRLRQEIVGILMPVIYPDSMVLESDLVALDAEQGRVYHRRDLIESYEFFHDTLGLAGRMRCYVVFENELMVPELVFSCIPFAPSSSATSVVLDQQQSVKEIKDFMTRFWLELNQPDWNAHVIGVSDSAILFSYRSGTHFKLPEGITLYLNRSLRPDTQLEAIRETLHRQIDYYRDVDPDQETLKKALEDYVFFVEGGWTSHAEGAQVIVFGEYIGKVRLQKLFDTTGIAVILETVPWDRPRVGDYLDF